jgi:hypothetical protein
MTPGIRPGSADGSGGGDVRGGVLMRVLLAAVSAVLVALLVVPATSAVNASSWRATITGTNLHGGATTIIAGDGTGSISVKLTGVTPGQEPLVLVNPTACPTEAQQLFGFTLPAASATGTTAGRHTLSAAEIRAYTSALSAKTKLSLLVVTSDDHGCGDQVGAPSVGTARLTGTVPTVLATWDIRYPVVAGIDANAAAAINARLASDAQKTIAAFQADAANEGSPMRGFPPTTASQTFSVALARPTVLSLGELFIQFNTGAAHPFATLSTYTFNLATGARYRLADLFRPGTRWVQLLSAGSRTMLQAKFHDPSLNEFINPGTTPSASNFAGWELLPSGLEITFGEYQVAPYAFGMPSIVIPWPVLRPLMRTPAPI